MYQLFCITIVLLWLTRKKRNMVFCIFKKNFWNSSAFACTFFCFYLVVNRWCKNRTWLDFLFFAFLYSIIGFPSFSYLLFRFLLNNGLWNISFWLVLTISIQTVVVFLYFRLIIFLIIVIIIFFYFCWNIKH